VSLLAFVATWLALGLVEVSAQTTHQVLILHSYHPEFAWTQEVDEGIRDGLRGVEHEATVHTEYLDFKRVADDQYSSALVDILRLKRDPDSIHVVIAADNDAIAYALTYREELFPRAEIVFCGYNPGDESSSSTAYTRRSRIPKPSTSLWTCFRKRSIWLFWVASPTVPTISSETSWRGSLRCDRTCRSIS